MADDKGEIEPLALDMSLDDIEDLPGFITPPTGAYHVEITEVDGNKEINENIPLAIDYKFKVVDVVEYRQEELDIGEEAPKPGDIFNFFFNRSNKYALNNFKNFVKPISVMLGSNNLQAILDGSKGVSMLLVIKRKKNKTTGNFNSSVVKSAIL